MKGKLIASVGSVYCVIEFRVADMKFGGVYADNRTLMIFSM